MAVTVSPSADGDRDLIERLMQLYLHDFSQFDERELGEDGRFAYPWLDAYWSDRDRRAYLFRVDDHPAGFALVRLTDPIEMAEFFVVRKYRRSGVGASAARQVFAHHPGEWSVSEIARNFPAVAFWHAVIPGPFDERTHTDGAIEQRFTT
ncbi:MAG TPA: GNAT family N-acetyltransferase [Humibacter sp.]|nr:GNAT family N-acetyltransferase [Humibacter sp.]